MAQYDGSIRISTKISTDMAEKSLETLSYTITQTAKEISKLRSKMDALKGKKFYTDDYKKLQEDLKQAEGTLSSWNEELKKTQNENGIKAVNARIKETENLIDSIKGKMQFLEEAGKAFTFGEDTQEYANLERQKQYEEEALRLATRHYQAAEKLNDPYGRLSQALNDLNSKLSGVVRMSQMVKQAFSSSDVNVGGYERLNSAWSELKGTAGKVAESMKQSFSDIRENGIWAIVDMTNRINSTLVSKLGDSLERISGKIGEILVKPAVAAMKIGESIKYALGSAFDSIKEKAAGVAGSVINGILHPIQTLKSVANSSLNGTANVLKSALTPALEEIKGRVAGVAASIMNGIVHPFQTMKDIASTSIRSSSGLLSGMSSAAKKVGSTISTISSMLKKATSSMLGFGKSTKSSNNILQSSFKNILKYGLGIRSFYALVNKIRNGIKEGFGNLYNENENFKNSVNGLKASLLTLKNSFAGAFSPIVQIAIPYIQRLIGWLTSAMEAVGQFIAALTGKKTYTKAIKQTAGAFEDAAESANDAKEAAEGYLSPLDEINKYSSDKNKGATGSGGGGGTGGAGQMFEEVPIESRFEELAKKVKDIFSQFFAPLKEAWNREGQFVMDSWKHALQETWNLMKDIGRDFLTVWNEEATISMFSDILHIVGDIGLVVGNLADKFREAWNTNDIGLHILENIRDIFAIIIGHIRSAADYTVEWSKSLDFYPLLESINNLLEALKPLTDNIGEGLEWFYKNVLLPIAGWTIQEAIPVFLDMLAAAIYAVNQVIEVLKPLGTWLWENFLQPLGKWAGETIISAMTKVTELLTKLGDWISKHSEAIQKFITIIAPIAGVILLIANAGTILSVAVGALSLALGLLTSPITLIIAGIAALAAGFVYLYEHSEKFRNFIDGIIEGAKQLIPGIIEGIKEGWNSFVSWLGDLWDEIVKSFEDFFGIHSPSTLMAEMGKYLIQGLLNGIEKLAGNVKQAWESMKQTAVNTWETVKQNISSKWEQIKTNSKTTFNTVASNIKTSWDSIKTNVKSAADTAKNNIVTAWKTAGDNTRTAWESMKTNAVTAAKTIASNVSTKYSEIKDAVRNFSSSAPSLWRGAWDSMGDKVTSVLGSIKRNVSNVFSWISNSIKNLGNSLKNLVSKASSASSATKASSARSSNARSMFSSSLYAMHPALTSMDIPKLATGAVIPANREFLAVLGDQKHGTNIEAPLDTIKQATEEAVLNVLSKIGMSGGNVGGAPVNLTLQVVLDRKVLGQTMVDWGKLQQMATGSNPYALGNT